jgi:hypothetical protein
MMCKTYLGSVVALALVAGAVGASAAQTTMTEPIRIDFETGTIEAPPSGFTAGLTGKGEPVQWTVLDDPSAPAGPKVLAETSQDTTDYRFPLAILDGFAARDVEVRVRFMPVSGTVDQAAGLIARARDERNYYVVRANALEGNVRLYRVVDGDRQQFAGAKAKVLSGSWQELGLRVEGDRFTVSLDGKDLFGATDRTFAEPGQVGLWTKADSLTHFDDLVVQRLR